MEPRDAPINLSCSRGKLQFSRHLQLSVLNANLTHTHELFSNPPQVCQGEQRELIWLMGGSDQVLRGFSHN
ncbi:hypothetical protein BGP82_28810 [Pseudomonas putida]|uniref:Uncharacterized protein n=1 Tax=Pseudomonas putida TaxID=303 RepID=A0A2S3WKS5_PSEPU|nr:hypothetical protein BGP82_28810 [Pseudomonas putida]